MAEKKVKRTRSSRSRDVMYKLWMERPKKSPEKICKQLYLDYMDILRDYMDLSRKVSDMYNACVKQDAAMERILNRISNVHLCGSFTSNEEVQNVLAAIRREIEDVSWS